MASNTQDTNAGTKAVGAHTSLDRRNTKLQVAARSIRGINRNLRLEGVKAQATIAKVSGKKIVVAFKVGGFAEDGKPIKPQKTQKPVLVDNKTMPVKALEYGQWVTAIAQTLGLQA